MQKLIGVRQLQKQNPGEQNALSVKMELQADCFAGVWGNSTQRRDLLDPGDIEEGLAAAARLAMTGFRWPREGAWRRNRSHTVLRSSGWIGSSAASTAEIFPPAIPFSIPEEKQIPRPATASGAQEARFARNDALSLGRWS